eukprot:408841-Prymnesium_polylepis.1
MKRFQQRPVLSLPACAATVGQRRRQRTVQPAELPLAAHGPAARRAGDVGHHSVQLWPARPHEDDPLPARALHVATCKSHGRAAGVGREARAVRAYHPIPGRRAARVRAVLRQAKLELRGGWRLSRERAALAAAAQRRQRALRSAHVRGGQPRLRRPKRHRQGARAAARGAGLRPVDVRGVQAQRGGSLGNGKAVSAERRCST